MVHRPKYKYKTMKHIDENIGQMICVLAINDFSVTSEIWSMKEKLDLSWTYLIKIKRSALWKKNEKTRCRLAKKRVFAKHIFDKGLASKIHKNA